MKQITRRQATTYIRANWPSVALVMVGLMVGGLFITLSYPQSRAHEGGFLPARVAAKPVAALPDTAAVLATSVASAAASSCADNGAGKLLLVSIGQQHLWACDGTALVNQTAVTTGASGLTNVDDATPTGTWRIYSKQTNTYLRGSDVNGPWNDYVQYWMPFDGQVGFHDASWQTFPFGSSLYTTEGSHGCVHLPADFIAWAYGWAPIGTTVTVRS